MGHRKPVVGYLAKDGPFQVGANLRKTHQKRGLLNGGKNTMTDQVSWT